MLLVLAAIWGSSFMFIKVAVEELTPGQVAFWRVFVGAVVLLPFAGAVLGWGRLGAQLRQYAFPLFVVAIFNASIPFWLLAWSEKRLDSGLAAVLQASMPLFTALLALRFVPGQRVTGIRLVGVLIGFLGVVLLVGAQPRGDVLSALAVLLTALSYAGSTLYAGSRLASASPMLTSFGTLAIASLTTLPLGISQLSAETPSWKAIGAVLALGAVGLSVGFLLWFALISGAGASYAALVTYLVPGMALLYGAIFLDEEITALAVGGLALILAGVALGTGTLRLPRRAPLGETP
jgi:drug/metabolite transporter (DMT)-like permease